MVTGLIALFSALLISSAAIYFSVAGLAAIFSAYPISTIIMGSAIELGKLAGVVWLHHNWFRTRWWLKGPLSAMVIGVMFITSMGIFGYLSKSHVEQTSETQENVAQVDRLAQEIARHRAIIARADEKIRGYEDNGSGVDSSLNAQIDKEQARIDSAYDRVKPVIQVQRDIIAQAEKKVEARTAPFQNELTSINEILTNLQAALNNNEIRKAQAMVGTVVDGLYKTNTKTAINEFRERNEARRNELLAKMDGIRGTPSLAAQAAQEEITRIRASVQSEIDESNVTINRLRGRLGSSDSNDIELLIDTERGKIKTSNIELDTLIQEKFQFETTQRKLEAEVGPIKYIAEFVYNKEPDANLLEKAVTWLIIMLIFVFDPFAVFLLIAAQHSFEYYNKEKIADLVKDTEPEKTHNVVADVPPEPEVDLDESDQDWARNIFQANQKPKGHVYGSAEEAEIPEPWDMAEDALYLSNSETLSETEAEEWAQTLAEAEEDAGPLDEIDLELGRSNVMLTRVDDSYVNFNGKVYQIDALKTRFPEYNFDFDRDALSGLGYPGVRKPKGTMYLRNDQTPTHLYMSDGTYWHHIDKNILNYDAYSHEYIKVLIKRIGNGDYNPELLNDQEKKHIEELLSRDD